MMKNFYKKLKVLALGLLITVAAYSQFDPANHPGGVKIGTDLVIDSVYVSGSDTIVRIDGNDFILTDIGSGSGGVTSVGLALPSQFTISGSPVTVSGTLTGAWADTLAGYVFAAPAGGTGKPTFRALVSADIGVALVTQYTEYIDHAYLLRGHDLTTDIDHDLIANTHNLTTDIAFKLDVADTAAMLATYINKADTAAMLSNYIDKADTAAMLTPYGLLSETILPADTAAMLTPYINRTDTAAMLVPYIDRSDTAAMLTQYALLSEANSAFNSGSGITVDGSNNIDLGGTLDAVVAITGGAYSISFRNSASPLWSSEMSIMKDGGADLKVYDNDNWTGGESGVQVNEGELIMYIDDGGSIKQMVFSSTAMTITDAADGKGLVYDGDYSSVGTNRWLTDKEYDDLHLGGQNLNSTVYGPGPSEHGGVITYDSTGYAAGADFYTITDVVSLPEAAGLIVEVMDSVLFSNTSQTTIISLPAPAVIHDIYVYVVTTFDGSGTDQLDIGITGSEDRYESNLDVAVGAGFPAMSLTNIRDRMGGTTNITFDYDDAGADASAGLAIVYIQYSTQ